MRVVVFGASGRTGRLVLAALREAGHEPVAHGRSKPEGWGGPFVMGMPGESDAVRRALDGAAAAISCLASNKGDGVCLKTTQSVIEVAPAGFRYITLAGAAVDAAGDKKGLPDKIARGVMSLILGAMLRERQAELAALEASSLDWTMARPPNLTNGPRTGRAAVSFNKPASARISRADLAAALVEGLARPDFVRRAPFIATGR
jgi:putative NADH-flavin reductase